MTNCHLEYCIYNDNKACSLQAIKLDGLGVCTNCVFPTIPMYILNRYKADKLKMLHQKDCSFAEE